MRKGLVAGGYAAIGIVFFAWQSAMDEKYMAQPSPIATLMTSAIWPIALPVAMGAVLAGKSGRWHLVSLTS